MKVYAVRKSSDLWLDRHGYDSFAPCLMDEARAGQLASQVGGVIEVWQAVLMGEQSAPESALPELRLVG